MWSRPLAICEEPALQPSPVRIPINDLQRVLPALHLRRVEFAKVKHLALDDATTMHTEALAHRVVNVIFAIFASDTSFEEHAC